MLWRGLSLGNSLVNCPQKRFVGKILWLWPRVLISEGWYVTYCIRCVNSILPALSALRCAWNVTGYNIHVDCRENFVLHHCMLQGLQSQSIDSIVSCSQTLAGRRGSLRDSGYVWLLTMCSCVRCITVRKLHSRSACRVLPHEDVIYDAYIQELNIVVLHAAIFVPSQFLVAPVVLTPVLVRHTARMMKGLGYDHAICFASIDGQMLQSVLICIDLHGSILAERLNQ